jgi:hypothetical protein
MPPTQLGFYPCWKMVSGHIFAFYSPTDSVRRTKGGVKGISQASTRVKCARRRPVRILDDPADTGGACTVG